MAQVHPISWHKPLLSSFTVHIVWCIISSSRKKIGTIKSAEPFLMMSKFSRAHSSLLLCMLLFGLVVHLFRLFSFSRLPQMDSQNIFHCSICSSQQPLIVLLLGECVCCVCQNEMTFLSCFRPNFVRFLAHSRLWLLFKSIFSGYIVNVFISLVYFAQLTDTQCS